MNTTTDHTQAAREHYGLKGPALMAALKRDGFDGRTLTDRAEKWATARTTTMATAPTVEVVGDDTTDDAVLFMDAPIPAPAVVSLPWVTNTLPGRLADVIGTDDDEPAATVPTEATATAAAAHPCTVCGGAMGWPRPSGVCGVDCLNRGQGFTDLPARASDVVPHIEREREQLAALTGQTATTPTAPPVVKLPTRADVRPEPRRSVFSRIASAVRSGVGEFAGGAIQGAGVVFSTAAGVMLSGGAVMLAAAAAVVVSTMR